MSLDGRRLQQLLGDDFPGAGLSSLRAASAPELDLEAARVSPVPGSDRVAVRDLLARVGVTPIPCPACNADDGDHHALCPAAQPAAEPEMSGHTGASESVRTSHPGRAPSVCDESTEPPSPGAREGDPT